ncbi:hypothetical protein DOE73_11715 [Paenibacillus dendritiformis]|nr:hypothetical protein DOE73_11715 [Paenibacillus dendritiformis]
MKMDELFKEAEARLSYLASDEETRRRYALREKALHDRSSLLNDARRAGIKEGINNTALNRLKEGLDAALICRITGLDAAQIERLKENRMCKPETDEQE